MLVGGVGVCWWGYVRGGSGGNGGMLGGSGGMLVGVCQRGEWGKWGYV